MAYVHIIYHRYNAVHLVLQTVTLISQVEVCDHWHLGDRRETTSSHVVMEAHSPPPTDGEKLQGALQDKDHQQETQREASQAIRGGMELK